VADRRVVITGLGVVTPAGIGIEELWGRLLERRGGVGAVKGFDATGFPCSIGGELAGFSARPYVPPDYRKAIKVMARGTQIAVAAADLAVRDSGMVTRGIDPAAVNVDGARLACNIGSGLLCQDFDELGVAINESKTDGEFDLAYWGASGMNNLPPLWLLKYLPNMLACHVTIIHGAKGPSNTILCGDASGHLAIAEAGRHLRRGTADAAICGGAESKLNLIGLLRQTALGRLRENAGGSPAEACRPFDVAHDGTVIGEGAGVIILEEAASAERRGARIYAELAGSSGASDPEAIDLLRPTVGGMGSSVKNAMAAAGVTADQVDLVVAHGTGVPGEDQAEAREWREALGGRLGAIPAVAITGATGSLFAGAGGVQAAVAAMAIHTGIVPPTVNFARPADGCELNLSAQVRRADIRCAVTAAFTVGGQSCACVLRRYEDKRDWQR
jgi:3-oxoacyl-[acyl-carrier-protein] synthase II